MPATDIRARLAALRTDALKQLAAGNGVDSGLLALAAHAGATLAALDTAAAAGDAPEAARAIVTDDGERIMLASYSHDQREPLAVVELDQRRALRLAADLLAGGHADSPSPPVWRMGPPSNSLIKAA